MERQTENNMAGYRIEETILARIGELIRHYPEGRQKSALVPALHILQEQHGGWITTPMMDSLAEVLNITPIEVYEVATFYTQFNLQPVGRHVLEVCRTGPCCMVGAERLIEYLGQKLGIGDGQTTGDGMFTLKTVECLGACGYGPVIQVGDHYYEHLNEEKIDQLLEDLKSNQG